MARVVIDRLGTKRYYNDVSELHRDDGPAWISSQGSKMWYINGLISHSIEPPMISSGGEVGWYIDNKPGRCDAPAEDRPNGYKGWYMGWKIKWPELK